MNETYRRANTSSTASISRSCNISGTSDDNSEKPLLFRLSEACNKHRIFHQNLRRRSQNLGVDADGDSGTKRLDNIDQNDEDVDSENIPQRCCKDLKVLRTIIPKVEREYQLLPKYNGGLDCTGTGTVRNIGGTRQQAGEDTKPGDIEDLCAFYGTIISGTFCPHAHLLLFDEGRGGTEIVPRVHQLFRHISSQSIVEDTLSSLLTTTAQIATQSLSNYSKDNDVQGCNGIEKIESGHSGVGGTMRKDAGKQGPTIADKISFTIALLLDSVPEQSTQTTFQKDIVMFLYDLCIIDSSGVLQSDGERDALEVSIFTEIIERNPKFSENQFIVEIDSTLSLSLLQLEIIHALFLLLTLQHRRKDQTEDTLEHDDLPIGVTKHHDTTVLAQFVMDGGEVQGALFASIQQIMCVELLSLNQSNSDAPSIHQHIILSSQKKTMAANLLVLLLPDLSIYANRQNATTAFWMRLIRLCTRASLQHIHAIYDLLTTSTAKINFTIYAAILKAYDSYASMLGVLLRDTVLCPPHPYNSPPWIIWSLRSQIVSSLLDSVIYIPDILAESQSTQMINLCTIILRVIHVTLFPFFPPNGGVKGNGCEVRKQDFEQMKIRLKEQCAIKGIYPHLFRLLHGSSASSLAIGIIARLVETEESGMEAWTLLETASYMTQKKHKSDEHGDDTPSSDWIKDTATKKSRKLVSSSSPATSHTTMTTDPQQELNHSKKKEVYSLLSDTSIVSTMSNFFDKALTGGMSIIDAVDMTGRDMSGYEGKFLSSLDSIVTTSVAINITNSCRLIESILPYQFNTRQHASEIHKILSILWKAGYLIAEYIFIASRTKSSHNCSSVQLQKLLDIIIRIGDHPYSYSSTNSDLADIDFHRKQLSQSISNCAMEYWQSVPDARIHLQDTNRVITHTLDSLDDSLHHQNTRVFLSKDFDEAATTMLSREEEFSLLKRISKRQTHCQGLCCRIRSFFGMPPWQNPRIHPRYCFCTLINRNTSYSGCKRTIPFINKCNELLLEQILSTYQRCILFASIHPVKDIANQMSSKGEKWCNRRNYRSTLSIVYETMGNSSPASPEIIASSIVCFPILLLSIVRQNEYTIQKENDATDMRIDGNKPNEVQKEENETSGSSPNERQYISLLKRYLGEIKYKHCFLDYISGHRNSDEKCRILGKLAFEALTRVITIYTNTSKCKKTATSDDTNSGINGCFIPFVYSNSINANLQLIMALTEGFEEYLSSFSMQNDSSRDWQQKVDSTFQESLFDLLISMAYTGELFESAHIRRARWEFIRSSCYVLAGPNLRKLASFIPSRNNTVKHRNSDHNEVPTSEIVELDMDANKPIPALIWLLETPFMDDDTVVRRYAAERLGSFLCTRNFEVMHALLYENMKNSDKINDESLKINTIISLFFDTVDDLLNKFCGVAQSQLSCTVRMSRTDHACTSYTGSEKIETMLSRQVSAIRVIKSLCQNTDPDTKHGASFIEKGLTRLIRLWIDNLNRIPREYSSSLDNREGSNIVSTVSFEALYHLHVCGSFGSRMLKHCEESFLPVIFSEILSHNIINEQTSFTTLTHFIQTFFMVVPDHSFMRLQDESERIFATLSFVDSVLPTVITGLVIEQDYEALCACTGFRLYLISEYNRLEKQLNYDQNEEVIVSEAKMQNGFKRTLNLGSAKGLKRQTSLLCVSEQGNLKVLSKVLPHLLLETQRAPLLFFLRTVLQSEVSLRALLEQKELTVIEDIIWELGKLENENEAKNAQDLPWFERHSNNIALQALKKAALILKGKGSTADTSHIQNSPSQSSEGLSVLDSADTKLEAKTAAETWVRKHFMMLLVTVVTMRWKRGYIDTKIRALQCLRVLLHFLRPQDSPQYMTQILTMVDSVMSFKPGSSDPPYARFKLRLLAVKALTHFIDIVLLHELNAVGENLCKIVVSISPLFETGNLESELGQDDAKLDCSEAIDEATKMLQSLVDGENGRLLASYFNDVPFMPKHSRLQPVRESLRMNGIDFDNSILTVGTTQNEETIRRRLSSSCSIASGRSCKDDEVSPYTAKMHLALRGRLHTLKNLLNHENDNVRHVVLSQLSNLIYSNRGLFHSLTSTENTTNEFLTVEIQSAAQGVDNVRSLVDCLLKRCILETNTNNRLQLATCFGEISAIDPNYMGRHKSTRRVKGKGLANEKMNLITTDDQWILRNGAPWKGQSVKVHYELQLVTTYFVISLKAAPTPTDQHKIAFAIQEVLKMLDLNANNLSVEKNSSQQGTKNKMSPWLKKQLETAGVLNIIEPFWSSLYKQQEASKPTKPPFFPMSESYYAWVSSWTRFLIERSYASKYSRYKDLFFACRSSIRSEAGLRVIEFLLPLLVLDSLCFGTEFDRRTTVAELIDVLSFVDKKRMNKVQLQKAIATVFAVINTLQAWANTEIEKRHNGGTTSSAAVSKTPRSASTDSSYWPSDESIAAIEDLVKKIPLSLCAQAAFYVSMYAQSLCFLEMDARSNDVETIFEHNDDGKSDTSTSKRQSLLQKKTLGKIHLNGINIALAHRLFGELSDCDSMTVISQSSEKQNIIDIIHEREAFCDWNGVLQGCEQAFQIGEIVEYTAITSEGCTGMAVETNNAKLATSYLRALLQLNQLEGALNQVTGIISGKGNHKKTTPDISSPLLPVEDMASRLSPFAVEASWRLSQWDTLQQLVTNHHVPLHPDNDKRNELIDMDSKYSILLGKAMLGLHQQNRTSVMSAISEARKSVMSSLSVAAGENYSRSYPYILKLHCLREIEDASNLLTIDTEGNSNLVKSHETFSSLTNSRWNWNDRLDGTGTDITASIQIINIRLTLARLASELELEASLWLTLGKKARKGGLITIASNSLAHAQSIYQRLQGKPKENSSEDFQSFISEVRLQAAKIKYSTGESTLALQMVEDDTQNFLNKNEADLQKTITELKGNGTLKQCVRNILQSTEWMVEGGLKSGSEVMARYRLLQKLSPDWERAHFRFAKYIDNIMESRINALSNNMVIKADDDSSRIEIMRKDLSCQKYLLQALKEYGEAVRLGNKHEYEALPKLLALWFEFTAVEGRESESDALHRNQDKANQLVSTYVKTIPAISYYNVLPQLISRVGHNDKDTVTIVLAILRRVLTKFPSQALWSLGHLRHSVYPERKEKGEDIFKGAQKSLRRSEEMKMHDLLESSKSLFKYLIDLAKYQSKRRDSKLSVHPWKGAVELREFVPPIQAALTVSQNAIGRLNSREAFPPHVPRMRAFSSSVQLMTSKARPKKVTVYAIPESSQHIKGDGDLRPNGKNRSQIGDIGEMHFLVKQEAKGDLRKDARVQDLNNVINRLFAISAGGRDSGRRHHRRLHLRTFSVICLSEDCGILEWVPNTDSFRNLVGNSYNPQVSHHCSRRRGKRNVNINDHTLRTNFMKCQDMYVKNGNLTRAAQMFDDLCLKEYPPLFYWWFIQNFQDPHKWFEARTKFALSAAAWSAVGHVIGLGDRHSENILVDISNGECVHVDFDCIFDKGLYLPRPEVVPFRLTPNMLDAFGPTGANGAFSGGLVEGMLTLRSNKDILLSVLEPFLRDPVIDWRKHRSQQKVGAKNTSFDRESVEAKRSAKVIEERLNGVYNLRNPNVKKIRRVDGFNTFNEDDEMTSLLPLSVEGQAHKMITEASSHENLIQLYFGWMPWI